MTHQRRRTVGHASGKSPAAAASFPDDGPPYETRTHTHNTALEFAKTSAAILTLRTWPVRDDTRRARLKTAMPATSRGLRAKPNGVGRATEREEVGVAVAFSRARTREKMREREREGTPRRKFYIARTISLFTNMPDIDIDINIMRFGSSPLEYYVTFTVRFVAPIKRTISIRKITSITRARISERLLGCALEESERCRAAVREIFRSRKRPVIPPS